MAKYVYGIDLGTTYSCIAYVDETGRVTVVKNLEGDNITPSVVNFANPKKVVAGQIAKENAVIDPDNTVSLVKRLMGKSDFAISYNGEDKSPEEVSAFILRKMALDAGKQLDTEVKDVVITCPAYFGTAERTATKNAGKIADLNVLEIISEPTAAAIYYGCTKTQEKKTVLVFDLGGGTFDVTIMSIDPEKIEVVCSDGNHELGGKDWDEAVMRYLLEQFKLQTKYDGDLDEYAQQDLRLKAESAKQQLTSRDEVPVMLDIAGLRARIMLTIDKFDEITDVLLKGAIEKTDSAIEIAKSKGFDIDEFILVGGSTRMPQVTKAIVENYGVEPKVLDQDEAVAKGAAIYAVNVYIENQEKIKEVIKTSDTDDDEIEVEIGGQTKKVNVSDYKEDLDINKDMMSIGGRAQEVVVATTKSFAVEAIINDEPKCCNMIIKNEPMPDGYITVSRVFGTYRDNMENVEIVVYESDFMDDVYEVDEEFVLGRAILELSGDLPKGSKIEITLTLNRDGILEVSGVDLTNNKKIHATMQSKGIMSEEKVEEIKEKSKSIVVQ